MATAEQIKALIKSHFEKEDERFITFSLQIAAYEAKLGHSNLATDLKKLIDKGRSKDVPKLRFINNDLQGLVLEVKPKEKFSDLIVPVDLHDRIKRVLREYKQKDKLKRHGLENRRKILLAGPPGTGKTLTASVISSELHLPHYVILMDKMVTKFMGETSAKLRQIFEIIAERRGVYLFDEFDAIGGERGKENDVGEMRRVLNSFLQFIEKDESESVIVAATNNHNLLDQALFRRFDDILHYKLPSKEEALKLIETRLGVFRGRFNLDSILPKIQNLSHAEISKACLDSIKETILSDKTKVDKKLLMRMLEERTQAYHVKN